MFLWQNLKTPKKRVYGLLSKKQRELLLRHLKTEMASSRLDLMLKDLQALDRTEISIQEMKIPVLRTGLTSLTQRVLM